MWTNDDGFTLVEAVVGVAFVSVIVAGIAGLVTVSTGLIRDARDDTVMSLLAIQKIEQLRATIAAGLVVPMSPSAALEADIAGFSDSSESYVRRWRVSPVPSGSSSARLLQVRVLVSRRAPGLPHLVPAGARASGEVVISTIAYPR